MLEYVFVASEASYAIAQLEEGAHGTPHLQGYFYWPSVKSFKFVKSLFPEAHWETSRGTPQDNKRYCSKSEGRLAGPWEFGEFPLKGKRSDLNEIKDRLTSGASILSIAEDFFGQFCRYSRAFKEYKMLVATPRDWEMVVSVFYGPTGTGKSRRARELYPGAYWKSKNSGSAQFWDGYDGQNDIIVDEFYGWLPYDFLLRLTDRYPLVLDVKHAGVQILARNIVFTSNRHPKRWYRSSRYAWGPQNPFTRRVKVLEYFGNEEFPTAESYETAESKTDFVDTKNNTSVKELTSKVTEEFDWTKLYK